MIKVVNDCTSNKTFCESCGVELLYEQEDIHIGEYGCRMITCPECGCEVDVMCDEKRTIPPTFPLTFGQYGNGKKVSDAETQAMVDRVREALVKTEVGEHCLTGIGDTIVIGLNFEDEYVYYVGKNYYEDIVSKE